MAVDLPSSNSATQLCFNRNVFTRQDFNVEKFLISVRRRASIEQIQRDLRLYLKILQNSMIELINEDYADFVNLSSNLVNLRATIQKLETDLGDIFGDFDVSTSDLSKTVQGLESYIDNKKALYLDHQLKERETRILSYFKKLKHLLSKMDVVESQSARATKIERISNVLSATKLEVRACDAFKEKYSLGLSIFIDTFQKLLDSELVEKASAKNLSQFAAVIEAYDACDRRDAALVVFIAEFLEPQVRDCLSNVKRTPAQSLGRVFAAISHLWNTLRQIDRADFVETRADDRRVAESFIGDCCLTVLLSLLDTEFAFVLVPTEPQLFHECYTATTAFARAWHQPTHPLLQMALSKYSLSVYFRLVCHNLNVTLDPLLTNYQFIPYVVPRSKSEDVVFAWSVTHSVLEAITRLWSDDCYLDPIAARLWDYTCKLLNKYQQWSSETIKLMASASAVCNGDAAGDGSLKQDVDLHEATDSSGETTPRWHNATLLIADIHALEAAIFEVAFNTVWPKIRQLGGETNDFGRCLTLLFTGIKTEVCEHALDFVTDRLLQKMRPELEAVSEVPRQYRWTRKAAPTKPSSYTDKCFDVSLRPFRALADRHKIPNEVIGRVMDDVVRAASERYLSSVSDLLESVDKMSSSLSRLKRGAKATATTVSDSATTTTDDQKIRLQIALDLAHYRRLCEALCPDGFTLTIDWRPFEQLQQLAAADQATAIDGVDSAATTTIA